jgi:hypothetical protein
LTHALIYALLDILEVLWKTPHPVPGVPLGHMPSLAPQLAPNAPLENTHQRQIAKQMASPFAPAVALEHMLQMKDQASVPHARQEHTTKDLALRQTPARVVLVELILRLGLHSAQPVQWANTFSKWGVLQLILAPTALLVHIQNLPLELAPAPNAH